MATKRSVSAARLISERKKSPQDFTGHGLCDHRRLLLQLRERHGHWFGSVGAHRRVQSVLARRPAPARTLTSSPKRSSTVCRSSPSRLGKPNDGSSRRVLTERRVEATYRYHEPGWCAHRCGPNKRACLQSPSFVPWGTLPTTSPSSPMIDSSVTDCSKYKSSVGDLNYPAIPAVFKPGEDEVSQRPVVTNVGENTVATYMVSVSTHKCCNSPRTLIKLSMKSPSRHSWSQVALPRRRTRLGHWSGATAGTT